MNFVEAYQHSINAVFCNIGKTLGAKRILEEAKKFGFYSSPPLETPGNTRSASGLYANGKLFDPRTSSGFSRVDPGRLAFGQEKMLTTPLQMAMVASAIANKGVEMRPTLIKAVVSPSGSIVKRLHPHVYKVATKPSTAGALKNMMVEVVQAGTGTAAQIPGVVVAGKTGTAETCACNTVYDAWFIFFAPADHPTVAGAVGVEHRDNGFGGAIAATITKQLRRPAPTRRTDKRIAMATDTEDRPSRHPLPRALPRRRRLGSGGMADVYRPRTRRLGRKVALKVWTERRARRPVRGRFKREARNAAGLNHPTSSVPTAAGRRHHHIAIRYLDRRSRSCSSARGPRRR